MGKMMAPEPKDRRDPNRACVVLSKGHEVVGPGYSRVTDAAAKVIDKIENLGNHDRVDRVSKTEQHYPSRVSKTE
jgi:transketolase N-terminal domain/subunit